MGVKQSGLRLSQGITAVPHSTTRGVELEAAELRPAKQNKSKDNETWVNIATRRPLLYVG